jgi:tetratricopeptide (TPR) repeat protein
VRPLLKNPFSKTSKRERASKLNTEGNVLGERGDSEAAISLYLRAAEVDPNWSVPAYNLGLHYKNLARWEESLMWSERAHSLAPDDEAATWNLGIAATALRRWKLARMAWKSYGIDVPDGEEEVDLPCGVTPVRLNPNGEAEVVWAERLDPARARLLNIPFPESGYRYRDIVVNDGAPVGYRKRGDREVPVFNVLAIWERSTYRTFAVSVECPETEPNLSELEVAAREVDAEVENWTTNFEVLCKACSEGRPHERHDDERRMPKGPHRVAIAHPSEATARKLIAQWALAQEPGTHLGELELLLD